jgi:hypothetical protein
VRHSTHEELMESGGWRQRLAAELQPGQTPDEAGITETRARELFAAGL